MSDFVEASPAPSIPPTRTSDSKILSDLATVIEKINLCTSMLQPLTATSQIDEDESLLTIIGFLEACVPRVRELVEAGMTGALAEDTILKCLSVNDSLLQVLEFVEDPAKCKPALHDTDTSDKKFDAFGIVDDDDLFGDQKSSAKNLKKTPASAPTESSSNASASLSTTTSALDELLLSPAATNGATEKTPAEDKDFDDFFNERVTDTKK